MHLARITITPKSKIAFIADEFTDAARLRYQNLASWLPVGVLESSAALKMLWRVEWYPQTKEYGPVKPLWLVRQEVKLAAAGDVQRIA